MIKFFKLLCTACVLAGVASCGGGGGGISVLPTSDSFDESDLDFNPKMDILWVVDPSKSMYEEVELVRNNIQAFVSDFITKGYEYRMGVISTAAWSHEAFQADPGLTYLQEGGNPVFARLHKGECVDYANSSGNEPYLSWLNADQIGPFITQFKTNFDVYGVELGTSGCGLVGPPFGNYDPVAGNIFADAAFTQSDRTALEGYISDERPLQSIRAFLDHDQSLPEIDRFVREDAYLAIIVVTDELDGSRDELTPHLACSSAGCDHTAQMHIDHIANNVKASTNHFGIYSIIDTNLNGNIAEQAATDSGGLSFDINADQATYIDNLSQMADAILQEATAYPLAHEPVPSTIQVEIIKADGTVVNVPRDTGSGGWTYHSGSQSITFSPEYLPTREDAISVDYTPAKLISGVSDQPRLDLTGDEVLENAANGTEVGTVSLRNGDATDGTYSIVNDSTGDAFAVDSVTGVVTLVNTTSIDTESASKAQVEFKLVLPDTTEFTRNFIIKILDEPDSSPVAVDDSFLGFEAAADPNGDVTVTGNLSYNDQGLDSSETHTYTLSGTAPAQGSLSINTDGSFTYVVAAADLGLSAGQEAIITFNYSVEDSASNSDIAEATITIEGENQKPVLDQAIPEQDIVYNATPGAIPFAATDITVSGGSNKENLIDGSTGSSFSTTSASTHFITMNFPSSKPLFEVQEFNINATTGHSLGNAILQVLADDGRVLTREVLPVDQSGSSSLSIPMTSQVIGSQIKILRPVGSVNPDGHQDIRIAEVEVVGKEIQIIALNLDDYFSDPDAETLTYYATDIYGERAAPSWISVSGNMLNMVPPSGADVTIGIIAEDPSGATEFTTVHITREGTGSAGNAGPISLLALDDAKRGGVSLKRFGEQDEDPNDPAADESIRHGEGDNFIVDPSFGEVLRNALLNSSSGVINLASSTYRTISNIPQDIRDAITQAGHEEQLAHFGDNYGSENGWDITPKYIDDKYPLSSVAFCSQSAYGPGSYGRILPCVNSTRQYGETYTGFFVPAKSGVYRFRASSAVDDVVRLLLSPTEYVEDLTPVFTAQHQGVNGIVNSLYSDLGDSYSTGTEFCPYRPAGPHDTSIFFIDDQSVSYQKGYALLEQGNVYALEIRFQEGGGVVDFEFQYDRKNPGGAWDGWKDIDASVMAPADGGDAHTPRTIDATGGSVSFDVTGLFYDAEDDALDYTARLVNADGTAYVGPGGTDNISEVGLSLSVQSGVLSGTLNATYDTDQPRITFKAKERHTSAAAEVESLPIKFDK